MKSRQLLTSRRTIPLDRVDDYLLGWQKVRTAAEAAGAHAWLYRGTRRQDHFIEFLEWDDETEPALPEHNDVASARTELDDTFGPGIVDNWEES